MKEPLQPIEKIIIRLVWCLIFVLLALGMGLAFYSVRLFSEAHAEDVTLSWTEPTGAETCAPATSTLPVLGYRIYQQIADTPDTSLVIAGLLPGDYIYTASAYNADGESRLTNTVSKTSTSFQALAGATVYQVVTITNAFWLLPVGTVTADIDCIISESVKGKYAIPFTGVTWSPGVVEKPMVVADCE